jgi:uncharacterized protein YjlB
MGSDAPHETPFSHVLMDDGTFPNSRLPLVVFQGALVVLSGREPARRIEEVFLRNGWGGGWRNGIYHYHHYHSTAHEALGVYRGAATVQLGGPDGVTMEVRSGDVIIIPAGVAHKNLDQSQDFAVVGVYPPRQQPDMNYGRSGERPGTDRRIARVALPEYDPVYGADGPLVRLWEAAASAASAVPPSSGAP